MGFTVKSRWELRPDFVVDQGRPQLLITSDLHAAILPCAHERSRQQECYVCGHNGQPQRISDVMSNRRNVSNGSFCCCTLEMCIYQKVICNFFLGLVLCSGISVRWDEDSPISWGMIPGYFCDTTASNSRHRRPMLCNVCTSSSLKCDLYWILVGARAFRVTPFVLDYSKMFGRTFQCW